MRTQLGKDPIKNWEKMKKYLRRQFLPPHYKDLVYHEAVNCKQLGNSIYAYTKKFYRLQSYLDFNVLEEYSISRYKNGLCWAIRERLSAQSFYYLSDIVLVAEDIEQLLEREKTMRWKPQTLHHTTIEDVKYLGVSATQNYSSNLCNPKEIASTLSSKACGGQREYVSNMPSKSMLVDLAHVIKNDDHASTRVEKERQHHFDVSKGDTIKDNVGLVCIDDQVGDDMVSACLVKKTGFEIENNAMPYHINMIR